LNQMYQEEITIYQDIVTIYCEIMVGKNDRFAIIVYV